MAILTDKDEKTDGPDVVNDMFHIVDKSVTTGNAAGTSFRISPSKALLGLGKQVIAAGIQAYPGFIIVPGQSSSNPAIAQTGDMFIGANTTFFGGDFVIMIANTNNPSVQGDFDLKYRAE